MYDSVTGGQTVPPLGSPEAALQMLDQLNALIAQFKAEADQIAEELRGFLPHSDPGRYLELTRRYGELQRWISTCEAHAA